MIFSRHCLIRGKVVPREVRPMFPVKAASAGREFHSIFELAKATPLRLDAFERIFDVYSTEASCSVGETLSKKYGAPAENRQLVVSARNKFRFEQTWFNAARSKKPQNFKTEGALHDPTQNGMNCDFCDAYHLTAVDDFGRVDLEHVMSGSNLFKYCAPCHGVLVFREHHPLQLSVELLCDLMRCTQEWVDRASAWHSSAGYPLFVWNCLERAGASQFHGHAQVMLSEVPFPCYERLKATQKSYSSMYPGETYLDTLFDGYREVGLLRSMSDSSTRCVVYPCLTPWKDMEVVVWGPSLTSPAFCGTLFAVLRTLMTDFGMQSFNVGIQGIPLPLNQPPESQPSEVGSVLARVASRGKLSSRASDFGGLEVFGGASIGHTDPFEISRALDKKLHEMKTLKFC